MAVFRTAIIGVAMTSLVAQAAAQDGRGGIRIKIPDLKLEAQDAKAKAEELRAKAEAAAEAEALAKAEEAARLKARADAAAAAAAASAESDLAQAALDLIAESADGDDDGNDGNGNDDSGGGDAADEDSDLEDEDETDDGPTPTPTPTLAPTPAPTPTPTATPTSSSAPVKDNSGPLVMKDAVIADYVPGDVIYFSYRDEAETRQIAANNGLTIRAISLLDQLGISMISAKIEPGDTVEEAVARLTAEGAVEWAQPNIGYQLLGNSRSRGLAMHGIGAGKQKQKSRGAAISTDAKIVLIDSPVDIAHESLSAAKIDQVAIGIDQTPASHGTAIAELLVGSGDYEGAARGAHLISIPAFSNSRVDSWQSTTEWLMKAFNEAARLRPNVANLSFGARLEDPGVARILALLEERGVCVASAAGNGEGAPVLFPGRHPTTLAIAAVDDKRRAYTFGSRGPEVDIAAWGVSMSAAVPGGRRLVSGTSFATALVSGAMLRMPACNGGRAPAIMRSAIVSDALDLGVDGKDDVFGAGLFRMGDASLAELDAEAPRTEEFAQSEPQSMLSKLLGGLGVTGLVALFFILWRRRKQVQAQ